MNITAVKMRLNIISVTNNFDGKFWETERRLANLSHKEIKHSPCRQMYKLQWSGTDIDLFVCLQNTVYAALSEEDK